MELSLNALLQCDNAVLFFNPYSYQENCYSRNRMLMDTQALGAIIQNFLLLSTESGISTLWINDIYYAKEEIEDFCTDGKLEIIAAITVGYSSKDRNYTFRNDLSEILF